MYFDPGVTVEKVQVSSAPHVVSDLLRRNVQLGVYSPGDMLPPQHELARTLGVSRTTLREALRILEGEGLVELRRGAKGGTLILASAEPVEIRRLKLVARLDEFDQWLEYRVAVEAAAAGLAAIRASSAVFDMLAATIEDVRQADSVPSFRSADSAFHVGIAEAARNEPIRRGIEDARAVLWQAIDSVPFAPMLSRTLRGHEAVLAALRDRDAPRAREAMAAHVDSVREEMRIVLGM